MKFTNLNHDWKNLGGAHHGPPKPKDKMKSNKYGAEVLGPSDKFKREDAKPGYSVWIEYGIYYQAPTVDPNKFGPHDYEIGYGTGTCECGCYMGSSSSSGDCDPFGACPENPNPFV